MNIQLASEILVDDALKGDERAMVQILTNLLSNAVKFSEPGGRVRIFARRTAHDGLALGVEDEGRGMSEQDLKKAMEPFGQAAAMSTIEGRGTGLGLPIVKGLVEAQGGTFHLESRHGAGTRAWAEFSSACLICKRRAA